MNTTVFLATACGILFEFFDYQLYGIFVNQITVAFFPKHELADTFAWVVFAAGFIARPVGALFIGAIGDTHGRERAMQMALICTAAPTTLIGLLPSYDSIGWGAVVGLMLLRAMQGFGVGGETSSAFVYCMECSPEGRKHFYIGAMSSAATSGMLLASLCSFLLHASLSRQAVDAWGWRLIFLAGSPLFVFAMQLRKILPPSTEFERFKAENKAPQDVMSSITRQDWADVLYLVAAYAWAACSVYLLQVWAPTTLVDADGRELGHSLLLMFIALAIPLAGQLADFHKKPLVQLQVAAICSIFVSPVCLYLLPQIAGAGGKMALLGVSLAPYCVFQAPFMTYIFGRLHNPSKRTTMFGVVFNGCYMVFGSTAPLIASVLRKVWGTAAIGLYLSTLSIVAVVCVVYKEGYLGSGRSKYQSLPDASPKAPAPAQM